MDVGKVAVALLLYSSFPDDILVSASVQQHDGLFAWMALWSPRGFVFALVFFFFFLTSQHPAACSNTLGCAVTQKSDMEVIFFWLLVRSGAGAFLVPDTLEVVDGWGDPGDCLSAHALSSCLGTCVFRDQYNRTMNGP